MGALRGGPLTAAGWYTVGTGLVWLGAFIAFRSIWAVWLLLAKTSGLDRSRTLRSISLQAIVAGLCLIAGRSLIRSTTEIAPDGRWRLPLVWWVMPFVAWLAVGGLVFGVVHALLTARSLTNQERIRHVTNGTIGLAAAALGYWLYDRDPKNTIQVLRGGIPIDPLTAVSLLLLLVGALAAVAFLSQAAHSKRLASGVAAQFSLVAGSVLFGLPLLYLLVTSFKEDRDMVSPNGIIWVPRVQRTVPYKDPLHPLFELQYEGQTVQATLTERTPDGYKLDIAKPLSLRGIAVEATPAQVNEVPRQAPLVTYRLDGLQANGMVVEEFEDGRKRVQTLEPPALEDRQAVLTASELEPIRDIGLRWQNYSEALSFLPPETVYGLGFLKNTLIIAILSVIGTILSSSLAAYSFARLRFPGRETWFALFLGTMMLPSAVTMLPQFLIYRRLGWIDTLLPLWAPSFFGSALNIFMLRQFFRTIPSELEDAAKIDGCSYGRTFWSVMLPQIKPALAVIGIWTFMGAWNNFMGPLIYINSPEKMPISYALQIFMGDRYGEPGLLMAFTTLTIIPVLLIFFFAQRYFIEGVTLSGFGGK